VNINYEKSFEGMRRQGRRRRPNPVTAAGAGTAVRLRIVDAEAVLSHAHYAHRGENASPDAEVEDYQFIHFSDILKKVSAIDNIISDQEPFLIGS